MTGRLCDSVRIEGVYEVMEVIRIPEGIKVSMGLLGLRCTMGQFLSKGVLMEAKAIHHHLFQSSVAS